MFELFLTIFLYILAILVWRMKYITHLQRLHNYRVRVHVNGIRGKSTVTRLIAGVLREAGYRTVAKATGSAAVTIDPQGVDELIDRRGLANVKEQQEVIARWNGSKAEALVMECMAIQPKYQEFSEKMVIQATIGVITNVREDHQDLMGESLPEIAASLAKMCPRDGYLITAEFEPALQELLRREAEKRGSKLIVANPAQVSDEDLARFDYLSFKDNVAIGLAVADLLGIDHPVAMRGMLNAAADPGVVRLQRVNLGGKPVIWANLFAVNDRESMIISMKKLEPMCDDKTVRIGILNNREDRERRAEQFGDVAVKDLAFDWLITFGAYEELVTRKLISNNFPAGRIVNLGDSAHHTPQEIMEAIVRMIPAGFQALLVGFVNIHTHQAEAMMEYFDKKKEEPLELEGIPLAPVPVYQYAEPIRKTN